MNKRKPKIAVEIIVEGQTEENYIKAFFRDVFRDIFVCKVRNLKGGDYLKAAKYLERYRGREVIVFVVLDLDRVEQNNELAHLRKLCENIKYIDKYANIFFTYTNFETFLSYHFSQNSNIAQILNTSIERIKSNERIYETIKNHGGSYDNTTGNFDRNNLCYDKIDTKFPELDVTKLALRQSGLMNLKDYCLFIKQELKR